MVRSEQRKDRTVKRSLSSTAQFHTTPTNISFSFLSFSLSFSLPISEFLFYKNTKFLMMKNKLRSVQYRTNFMDFVFHPFLSLNFEGNPKSLFGSYDLKWGFHFWLSN